MTQEPSKPREFWIEPMNYEPDFAGLPDGFDACVHTTGFVGTIHVIEKSHTDALEQFKADALERFGVDMRQLNIQQKQIDELTRKLAKAVEQRNIENLEKCNAKGLNHLVAAEECERLDAELKETT